MTELDAKIAVVQERNALRAISGRLTDAERDELRDLYGQRDRALAQALLDGIAAMHKTDDEVEMLEAEGAIIERCSIPPDHTEQGLTRDAVERIEAFVSKALGEPWTYADAGLLGVEGVQS